MQTSVDLQEPFSYSICLIILLIALLLIPITKRILEIIVLRKSSLKIKRLNPINKERIKQKYINKLNKIEKNFIQSKISNRRAYQNLSIIIRYFVYEITGIKVQNYTLEDIEKLDMPLLYELVNEYYIPEFAEHSYGNFVHSLEKTRNVISNFE